MGDDNWMNLEKFMSNETIEAVCRELAILIQKQKKKFSIVLHGGEPLLLGIVKLTFLLKKLREVLSLEYPISLQTNGILISAELLDICSAYRVSMAVSIDGPEQIHDRNRLTHQKKGTFSEVLRGILMLKSHRDAKFMNAGLLAVVDPNSDATEVYYFFKSLLAPSVDFLYKDGNHSRLPLGKSSVESIEFGKWMSDLFKVYLNDPDPMPIRVLDDMLKVLLGGVVSKEGMGMTDFGIVIIDTDGTIMKNDTLKSSFNGADKFIENQNIKKGNLTGFLDSAEFLNYREMQRPTCLQCTTCPELKICGGGMILHRWEDSNSFNNPSVYCTDQLHLIGNMRQELAQMIPEYA
jgi:uncharacterized protein